VLALQLVVAHLQIADGDERLVAFGAQIVHLELHGADGRRVLLLEDNELVLPLVLVRLETFDALLEFCMLFLCCL
jgi:hypothetical protein